jgi:hypothetical protein
VFLLKGFIGNFYKLIVLLNMLFSRLQGEETFFLLQNTLLQYPYQTGLIKKAGK